MINIDTGRSRANTAANIYLQLLKECRKFFERSDMLQLSVAAYLIVYNFLKPETKSFLVIVLLMVNYLTVFESMKPKFEECDRKTMAIVMEYERVEANLEAIQKKTNELSAQTLSDEMKIAATQKEKKLREQLIQMSIKELEEVNFRIIKSGYIYPQHFFFFRKNMMKTFWTQPDSNMRSVSMP